MQRTNGKYRRSAKLGTYVPNKNDQSVSARLLSTASTMYNVEYFVKCDFLVSLHTGETFSCLAMRHCINLKWNRTTNRKKNDI